MSNLKLRIQYFWPLSKINECNRKELLLHLRLYVLNLLFFCLESRNRMGMFVEESGPPWPGGPGRAAADMNYPQVPQNNNKKKKKCGPSIPAASTRNQYQYLMQAGWKMSHDNRGRDNKANEKTSECLPPGGARRNRNEEKQKWKKGWGCLCFQLWRQFVCGLYGCGIYGDGWWYCLIKGIVWWKDHIVYNGSIIPYIIKTASIIPR